MAEQTINLNNFKASGVYTVEIDQSENVVLPLTTGRLIIGSSRVGPFNTVVLVNDLRTLKAVYGDIDPKLEKAGSYFHRTIEVALREGPVFAMNVVPLDAEVDYDDPASNLDQAFFATFNTESASNNNDTTTGIISYPVVEFFNKQKLWFADLRQLNRVKNLALGPNELNSDPGFGQTSINANKILSFANLGHNNVTIWVRKSDIRGFDVTAKEWYSTVGGGTEIEFPSFVHPDDFISDYFVEVIVINGDWSNYLKLSKDPIYSSFFDESGLLSSKSAEFFALREVKVVTRTIGCLIPEFRDQRGLTVAIDRVINRLFPTTGILCALDVDKVDLIDLTESNFVDQDVRSHRIDIVGHGYDDLDSLDDYKADDGGYYNDGTTQVDFTPLIDVLSYKKPADAELVFNLSNNPSINTLDEADFLNGFQDSPGVTSIAIGDVYLVNPAIGDNYLVAMKGSTLYNSYANGFLKNGDIIDDGTNQRYIKVLDNNFSQLSAGATPVLIPYVKILMYLDISLLNQDSFSVGNGYYTGTNSQDYMLVQIASGANFKYTFSLINDFIDYSVLQPNKLILGIDSTNKTLVDEFLKVNHYIKAQSSSGRIRLLKIISISSRVRPTSPFITEYTVTTMAPSVDEVIGLDVSPDAVTGDPSIRVYKGVYNFATSLKGQYVKGFKIRENSLPDGTADRLEAEEQGGPGGPPGILAYLFKYTAIPQALATGELVDFRYVVDSYSGTISASSKYYLAKLAALHGQAMAILNAPSVQQFEKSVDPNFLNQVTKIVSTEYISIGGNLSLNPSFTFKFAEEDINGIPLSSYATYHFPNLIVRSGNKNLSVPPSGYISNLYVRKFKNGTPFYIVAGGKRGAINDPEVVGIEYDLTDEDRAFLEPVGFNLIVKRRGFGNLLFSNNTAYQRINSALNNAHVRDNLSTIERDIERILFNFLFDFNDEITRLRVKTIVQNYLDAVVAARGLTSYEIIFDSSNNTSEVISANTAIIDIRVDFPRGIHKFINRITITRVGGQLSSESTGFIPSF